MRTAKTLEDTFEEPSPKIPHGVIQWKGTSVCMDLRCKCGATSHIDADFLYSVKCPRCLACYAVKPYVELVQLIVVPRDVQEAKNPF